MAEFKRRERKRKGPEPTHGAYSKEVIARYSDLRTKEGRRLEDVIQGLISDLGGAANVTAAQNIILGNIKAKLIVIFQISDYADRQNIILDEKKGTIIPCLGRNFLAYSEALRRDLESLQKFSKVVLTEDMYEKWRKEMFEEIEAKENRGKHGAKDKKES